MSSDLSPKQKHASVAIGLTFFVAALSVVGFTVVFWYNDNIRLEGIFIGITFMLLAVGLVMWSQHLLPEGPFAEEFPELQSGVMEEAKVLASLDRGQVGRRKVLIGSLGLAGAAITSSVARAVSRAGTLLATPYRVEGGQDGSHPRQRSGAGERRARRQHHRGLSPWLHQLP